MNLQMKYFLIKNREKRLINTVPMNLSLNHFKEEIYDSGWNQMLIDGKTTMSGAHLQKDTMSGNFNMTSDIKKHKTVFTVFFDLNYFSKTCFTFLFYDDVYISVEIERSEND